MSLSCIYHKTQPFRVVDDKLADELVAEGEWFRHPNDVNKQKELTDEKPIRRKSWKGRDDCESSTQSNGSRTQRDKPIREESSKRTG